MFLFMPQYSEKNDRGRPVSIYHVNDISVYLGRQRGAVDHVTHKKLLFCAQVLIHLEQQACRNSFP